MLDFAGFFKRDSGGMAMVNKEKEKKETPVKEIYPFGRPKEAIPAEKGPVKEIRLPGKAQAPVSQLSGLELQRQEYDRVVQSIIRDRKKTLETDTEKLKHLAHELIDVAISQPPHLVRLETKLDAVNDLKKMITQLPFSSEEQDGIRTHLFAAAEGSGQDRQLKALLRDFDSAFAKRRKPEKKE
ncbi:MAG: hypothetical protein PHF51_04070 [Candidatus ainarchaeum sp.]|nr:hypothetical protein [Candidatus ainarchaeum sp.]